MDANMIANLQDRTSAKLRYAAVHLREIEDLPGLTGDDFDRAHQESFLFHLMGAVDAFLAEINCYYRCNLPDEGISPGNLRTAIIRMRGETSAELKELRRLEELKGSWLGHAKTMRHHSAHVRGVPRVYNVGGVRNSDEVWLRNPVSGGGLKLPGFSPAARSREAGRRFALPLWANCLRALTAQAIPMNSLKNFVAAMDRRLPN